jgi:hypothetical protein
MKCPNPDLIWPPVSDRSCGRPAEINPLAAVGLRATEVRNATMAVIDPTPVN